MTIVKLRDVVEIQKQSVFPEAGRIYEHYSLPAFDAGSPEIVDGSTILSGKIVVPDNAILMNKLNVKFKRIWPVKKSNNNAIASTEFVPLIPKGIDYWFLYYWLTSDDTTLRLCSLRSGTSSSHQRVKLEAMLGMDIFCPPIHEQVIIGNYLRTFDRKIQINRRINDYLAT